MIQVAIFQEYASIAAYFCVWSVLGDLTVGVVVHTGTQSKGQRLRIARALLGISLQNLSEKTGFAVSSIEAWESGKIDFSDKCAQRFSFAFEQFGMFCAPEWILTSQGLPPHLMNEIEKTMFLHEHAEFEYRNDDDNKNTKQKMLPIEDSLICRELSFFINLHKNAMYCMVTKSMTDSHYSVGDCVAGISRESSELIGKIVILQPIEGEAFLCRLLKVEDNIAEISFSNDNSVEHVPFTNAAPILWHRTINY